MIFEQLFRKIMYEFYSNRDGYQNVTSYRKAFHHFLLKSPNVIHENSLEALTKILIHASQTSTYYRNILPNDHLYAFRTNSGDVLKNLPFLTKDIIEKKKYEMISNKFNKDNLVTSLTGGSTGTHTSFFRDFDCTAKRMGRQLAILELCGYFLGDRCGLIWGVHEDSSNPESSQNYRVLLRKFASGKETLHCSVMNDEQMAEYHTRLIKFRPKVLYGYPNAMSTFAKFISDERLQPITVDKIICTAERLTESQRRILTDVFHGEVYNLYCTREHGCVGFECGKHNGFHLDVGSVYVEIVKDGVVVEPGTSGEIVITDLLNYGMPFIRNKVGDRGTLSPVPCDCGNPLPLLQTLDGRETDMLYRPDGSLVSGVMLVDMMPDEPAIKAMQFIQNNIRKIDLNLVIDPAIYTSVTEARVVNELRQFMGESVAIHLNIVPNISRNPHSGKYQEVICRIRKPT
jgi:phenylacetate-CoA ligase